VAESRPAVADPRLDHFWSEEVTTIVIGESEKGEMVSVTLPPVRGLDGHRVTRFGTDAQFLYSEVDCSNPARGRIAGDTAPGAWIFFPPGSVMRSANTVVCASEIVFDLRTMRTVRVKLPLNGTRDR
jgi:hypothetical protein